MIQAGAKFNKPRTQETTRNLEKLRVLLLQNGEMRSDLIIKELGISYGSFQDLIFTATYEYPIYEYSKGKYVYFGINRGNNDRH